MVKLGELILNVLFPKRCVGCNTLGTYFCPTCVKKIEYIQLFCPICQRPAIDGGTHPGCQTPYGINGLYVLGLYKGPLKTAIKTLKYQFVSDLCDSLSYLLYRSYPHYIPRFDFFVPVPLHPKRERRRGFNQAALLATSLSNRLHILVEKNVLIKTKHLEPQANLKGDERRKNILGAFALTNKAVIQDKTIAVVDDVSTTGATLFECAKILKSQGAKVVWGIALAHGN